MQQWWNDLTTRQKWIYSAAIVVSTSAGVGAFMGRRPIVGAIKGSLVGLGLWGMGATAYTVWQVKQTIDKVKSPLGQVAPLGEHLKLLS